MIRMLIISFFYFVFIGTCFSYEKINLISNCSNNDCQFLEKRIYKFLENTNDEAALYDGLRFILNDGLIKEFKFEYKIVNNEITFKFNSKLNSFLQDVSLNYKKQFDVDISVQSQINNLKVPYIGLMYNKVLEGQIIDKIKSLFVDLGYLDISIEVEKRLVNNRVVLDILVDQKQQYLIKKINIKCIDDQNCLSDLILNPILKLENAPWKKIEFINLLNQIENKKRKKGFYDFSIKIADIKLDQTGVLLGLNVHKGIGHNFFISGTEKISKIELLNYVKARVLEERIRVGSNEIKNILKNYLAKLGFYYPSIKVDDVEGFNKNRNSIINHFIKINEKGNTRINQINISGVSENIHQKILELINKNQSSYHLQGYFLEDDFLLYNKIISDYLASAGYYFSEVSGPFLNFSNDKSNVDINFKVNLGKNVEIHDINYGFSTEILDKNELKKLKNIIGGAFYNKNLNEDKEFLVSLLKEKGYFFARYKKTEQQSEFFFDNSQKVILNYGIDPGKIIYIGKIDIIGLKKTKIEILNRELNVKSGDLLTPKSIAQINDDIVPLNLFSFVNVKPSKVYMDEKGKNICDISVQLSERDYGLIRLSPGYRTDLGFKIESLLQRNNIGGKNEAFSFNLRGNKRTSLSYLDSRRQNEPNNLIEFASVTSYTIPYIFSNKIGFQTNAELVRRRFYGFDADIGRLSFRLNKNFNDYLGATLRYQFENIKQYDATLDSDSGYFRIGSILASFFVDRRDRVVNPSSGSYHGLSLEVGNPSLLSMKDSNLEINFVKFVSRNRMYLDLNGLTLATSLTAGFQKNLAGDSLKNENGSPIYNEDGTIRTIGAVPSVKVFRLEGVDNVRGFTELEINKLDDDEDILNKRIQNTAYMINSKIELRRMLSDSIIGALFFDAGKVYVNSFKPLNLRKSGGVSFKFLTPVGTLDFDYGLKLDRKTNAQGQGEMFGRFHLAIGFF